MTMKNLSAYGYDFRVKVIYSIITSKEFLQNVADIIDSEHFESVSQRWIIDKTIAYFNKYNTYPTMNFFKIEIKKLTDKILSIAVFEELKKAYECEDKDLDYVQEEFHKFCAIQKVKAALLSSVDMLDAGSDTDDIATVVTKAVTAGKPKDKIHIYEKDVESRYREDARNPIPFPWKTLTDNTQGGMGGGDLIVPVSGPKGGKSWICIASAAYAATLGHNVMYYSLELSEDYVGKRFDAFFTNIDVDQLKGNTELIAKKISEIKGRIRIKKYPPGKTTLSQIENHLRRMKTQEDYIPHFVVIDYLEKLGNPKNRKDKNEDASDIFTEAKGLAEILNVPLMSPAQANRTAEGLDVIKGQHLAGTYEKFMIADIIFTVAKKTNIWYIMGNRYGEDDICYRSTFDRKTGHIVIDSEPYDPDGEVDLTNPDTKQRMTQKFRKLE